MYEAVVWTNAAHEYTAWSDAATRIFGYEGSEVLGRHFSEVFPRVSRQAMGRIWIGFDYRIMCWDAQHLLGWRSTEVLGHQIEEYAVETDRGASRLDCESGWTGVAVMCTGVGAIVAVSAGIEPTRGGYLLMLRRVIAEEGAGIDVAHIAPWYGYTLLDAKDGTPVVFASNTLAQRNGDGETITGYRCRIRPVPWSELFFAGTTRKEVKSNTPQIAALVLHGAQHVTRRVTGNGRGLGASSPAMTDAEVEHNRLVGENLRKARDARGKTQGQAADRIGVTNHTVIVRWEKGGGISWRYQKALADAYGIEDPTWFERSQTSVPEPPKDWTWERRAQ